MSDGITKNGSYYIDLAKKIKIDRDKEDLESSERRKFLSKAIPITAVVTSLLSVAIMMSLRNK